MVTNVVTAIAATIAAMAGPASAIPPPPPDPPLYEVRVESRGKIYCLDADSTGTGGNGNKVQIWPCNGRNNQLWYIENGNRLHNHWASLKYEYAGYLQAGNANNTPVTLNAIAIGSPKQFWGDLRAGSAREIKSQGGGCLDADDSGTGTTNGRRVLIYACNGQLNQQWHIDRVA